MRKGRRGGKGGKVARLSTSTHRLDRRLLVSAPGSRPRFASPRRALTFGSLSMSATLSFSIAATVVLPPFPLRSSLQGSLPFRVVEGYVGTVRLTIPLTSLYSESWRVDLEDVFVTVEPAPPTRHAAPAQAAQAARTPPAEDSRGAVGEGVRLIAGGLEAILQRLRATATRVVVRANLPRVDRDDKAPALAAVLRLQSLGYAPIPADAAGEAPPPGTALELRKSVEVTGLTVGLDVAEEKESSSTFATAADRSDCSASELLRPIVGDHNSGPCSVGVLLSLSWDSLAPSRGAHVSVSVLTEDVHVTLSAAQVACLVEAAALWSALAAEAPLEDLEGDGTGGSPGTRSLIESIMLPDCERVVLEAAGPPSRAAVRPGSAGGRKGKEPASRQKSALCWGSGSRSQCGGADATAAALAFPRHVRRRRLHAPTPLPGAPPTAERRRRGCGHRRRGRG